MNTSTYPRNNPRRTWQPAALLCALCLLLAGPARSGSLDAILNPDGTVRAGVRGSFKAAGYALYTAPDGQPVLRTVAARRVAGAARVTADNGTNGAVYAVAVDSTGNLCVGGDFTMAGGVAASNIAKWNGSEWSALGTGLNGQVFAIAVAGRSIVYAARQFAATGSTGGVAGVVQWNGIQWAPTGGNFTRVLNGSTYGGDINTLAVSSRGILYAGGDFDAAGGTAANNIAQWNGSSWSGLGGGLTDPTGVKSTARSLVISRAGILYVGGYFNQAGGITANSIASWNGSSWTAFGNGTGVNVDGYPGDVGSLALSKSGTLYVGGGFHMNGGLYASAIAQWSGINWIALGTGAFDDVAGLAISSGGTLYAAGGRSTSNSSSNYTIQWNGTGWSPLGSGTNSINGDGAFPLATSGNVLYAGGVFTTAGGVSANNIAQWDGTKWSPIAPNSLTAYHLPQPGRTTRRTRLNYRSTGIIKVGADDTTGTAFALPRSSGQTLAFRIQENPTDSTSGALADAAGFFEPQTQTADSIMAVYHHPAFVGLTGSHRDLHLQVIDNTVPAAPVVLHTYPIQAVRPPLLLVHGLWSYGSNAFPGLQKKLVKDGLYDNEEQIRYADYGADLHFADNAQKFIDHKNAQLLAYAFRNVSVSKVDIIGHSMGGLIARQYIQSPDYANKRDVNKLITLNTPHSGSPVPNFVKTLPPFVKTLMGKFGHDPTKGAVEDLSYNGPAIARLNATPNTHGVAIHAITTNLDFASTAPIEALSKQDVGWAGFLVEWMALTQIHTANTINALLDKVYHNKNDLVVGLNSQRGGLTYPYTSNVAGQSHVSGGNPLVQLSMEELLTANSSNTARANAFTKADMHPVSTDSITSIFHRSAPPTTALVSTAHKTASSTLQITSPTRNTVFTDIDSVRVTVAGSADVTRILLVCNAGTPEMTTRLVQGAGGSAYLRVPRQGLGRLTIAAFAFADSTYVQYDTLGTGLTTAATLRSVRIEPRFVYTIPGDSAVLHLTGTYSDGIEREVMGQSGVQFSFAGGGTARTRSAGWVTGLAPGLDSLRVSYAGRTDAVPVEVAAVSIPPTNSPGSPLQVWPNPAQETAWVGNTNGQPLAVYDVMGRLVLTPAPADPTSNDLLLDLHGLRPGMYILRCSTRTARLLVE